MRVMGMDQDYHRGVRKTKLLRFEQDTVEIVVHRLCSSTVEDVLLLLLGQ